MLNIFKKFIVNHFTKVRHGISPHLVVGLPIQWLEPPMVVGNTGFGGLCLNYFSNTPNAWKSFDKKMFSKQAKQTKLWYCYPSNKTWLRPHFIQVVICQMSDIWTLKYIAKQGWPPKQKTNFLLLFSTQTQSWFPNITSTLCTLKPKKNSSRNHCSKLQQFSQPY